VGGYDFFMRMIDVSWAVSVLGGWFPPESVYPLILFHTYFNYLGNLEGISV
jgi:hypothetical protein